MVKLVTTNIYVRNIGESLECEQLINDDAVHVKLQKGACRNVMFMYEPGRANLFPRRQVCVVHLLRFSWKAARRCWGPGPCCARRFPGSCTSFPRWTDPTSYVVGQDENDRFPAKQSGLPTYRGRPRRRRSPSRRPQTSASLSPPPSVSAATPQLFAVGHS